MHSKKNNNSKSRNFIQGLRPFSSTVPRGLKKKLRKGGYNFSNIVDNWTKVVGKNIATTCYPNTVKMGKDMREGTVILNVVHGNEVNIEYSKKEIMDKINSFFGYKCIDQIKLKIIHEKKINNGNLVSAKPKNNIFKTKLETLKNINLKNSLDKLIKAFNEKNN
jgi:hypothetical protein